MDVWQADTGISTTYYVTGEITNAIPDYPEWEYPSDSSTITYHSDALGTGGQIGGEVGVSA